MIQFFRKIRKRLLTDGKFSSYLVYALGEIILVVIGILIALAINNANQKRIEGKNEQIYLQGLKREFQTSKLKLSELIAVNQVNSDGAKKILEYTGNISAPTDEKEFSELLYTTFSNDIAFNPNNSLLNEIISSGNLKNISNTELRIQLTNWFSTLEDISRQEKDLGTQRERVLDLFRTGENSLRTVFEQAGVYEEIGVSGIRGTISNVNLLGSTEFENNLLMFVLTSHATEKAHYLPLMKDLEVILELIDEELK